MHDFIDGVQLFNLHYISKEMWYTDILYTINQATQNQKHGIKFLRHKK